MFYLSTSTKHPPPPPSAVIVFPWSPKNKIQLLVYNKESKAPPSLPPLQALFLGKPSNVSWDFTFFASLVLKEAIKHVWDFTSFANLVLKEAIKCVLGFYLLCKPCG